MLIEVTTQVLNKKQQIQINGLNIEIKKYGDNVLRIFADYKGCFTDAVENIIDIKFLEI